MEESASELLPDLKDLENKVGRKTPEGLLRWLREDTARLAGEKVDTAGASGDQAALFPGQNKRLPQGLAEKIRVLRLEMAYLRTIDIKIMHQLMAVNEGIEAVKWILEEKGTLASRCSSLTSSMYSLVESQETSRRGSWNSLQDPNDKLDGISIGSFLDTLADDMDEYCQTSSDPLSSTPSNHGGSFTTMEKEIYTNETHCQQTNLANGFSEKEAKNAADCNVESKFCHDKPCKDIGKLKIQKNGKIDHDGCKRNKMHIEYDAHWHWVQSQDDVTFL
ncbi:leucine rich adaptor protein 1 [Hemiscyllium ocellatum]|uniref:leucine rich adaptor protein 1 n=1 Tax=Hemiscyllium ocellatum TaxID=170820 RepID=UPI00296690A7|nr:leucine rich adaptor protein 1 [Hemiscyllium ocellatum]